jgi:hypothetical protein
MRRLAALLAPALGAVLALGCASRSLPPPPPKPPLIEAKGALPPDLDLVVRIDLARVRSALGASVVAELRRAAQASSGLEKSDSLLGPLFEHADVLLVGVRPRVATELDHVVVLEGRFDDFDPFKSQAEPPWERPIDLGGDVRRWDRRRAPSRGEPALAYAAGTRLVVLASIAEVDSTERAVEEGENPGALSPPSKGVISVAARVLPLAQAVSERSPTLAGWLRSATKLEGSADLELEGLRVNLAIQVDSPETAERLKAAVEGLLELVTASRPALAELSREVEIETAGDFLVLRGLVPRALLVPGAKW